MSGSATIVNSFCRKILPEIGMNGDARIRKDFEMPEPVRAWAAVAPDGTFYVPLIDVYRLYGTKVAAQEIAGRSWGHANNWYGADLDAWPHAERAGWRVVEVEIKIKEN
jgi:hypothetical protein